MSYRQRGAISSAGQTARPVRRAEKVAILEKLFSKADPLEAKARNLVTFSRIMAVQSFIPVIDRYKFLEQHSVEWDFFAAMASVNLALNRLRNEVSTDRWEHLFPIIAAQLQKLDEQGQWDGALANCQEFVMRVLKKNEPEDCQKLSVEPEEIKSALGLWVLWNVLRREPIDEELQAAPLIGHVLSEPFLDWWNGAK
jgi:hypothetical protein